jgi:hypothetical protein
MVGLVEEEESMIDEKASSEVPRNLRREEINEILLEYA